MHHHRTGAEEDGRRRVEQRDRLITDEPVRTRPFLSCVVGQHEEHRQAGGDKAQVAKCVHGFTQQATANAFTPAGSLTYRRLVQCGGPPAGRSTYDKQDSEDAESDQSNQRRAKGRPHLRMLCRRREPDGHRRRTRGRLLLDDIILWRVDYLCSRFTSRRVSPSCLRPSRRCFVEWQGSASICTQKNPGEKCGRE